MKKVTICFSATIVLLYVCYDLGHQFFHGSSLTVSIYRRFHNAQRSNSSSKCHGNDTNCCFADFFQLLEGRNVSGQYFLLEPDPPIPVDRVSPSCRRHLIPQPLPSSLSREIVRCYSKQLVTDATRGRVRAGLRVVKKLFDDSKIPLIAAGGSLLGSLRYHGLIPYDDDFDFRVPKEKSRQIKALLANLCRKDKRFFCKLQLSIMDHYQLLLGIQDPKKMDYASFIDFFFYEVRGDTIKTTDGPKSYSKSVIFPTIKRPLEGQLFDLPRDPHTYKKLIYGKHVTGYCQNSDHYGQARKGCKGVPCSALNSFLPFMVSSESPEAQLELVVNSSHVRSIFYRRKQGGA